jgi:hypothetical protein
MLQPEMAGGRVCPNKRTKKYSKVEKASKREQSARQPISLHAVESGQDEGRV